MPMRKRCPCGCGARVGRNKNGGFAALAEQVHEQAVRIQAASLFDEPKLATVIRDGRDIEAQLIELVHSRKSPPIDSNLVQTWLRFAMRIRSDIEQGYASPPRAPRDGRRSQRSGSIVRVAEPEPSVEEINPA
jgi:hypothetical protein